MYLDTSGNLKTESNPAAHYTYDALNRLIRIDQEGHCTHFLYDAFNRCLQINDQMGTRQLLYQGLQEIGSIVNGQVQEFRLVHPEAERERTFAIELKGETFFPLQDFRGNICALLKQNGSFAQWYRYSAFGAKLIEGNLHEIFNPWRFANRREVSDLSLFTHRLYNPRLMRWQTGDPLRFEDGLNLYHYVHNNPFCYKDPNGQFALAIPIVQFAFGVALGPIILPTLGIIATATIAYSTYRLLSTLDLKADELEDIEKKKEDENQEKFKFPANPDNLLPELPRDKDGLIQTADNLRLRPDKHPLRENEAYNSRHHGQHYHVETRRNAFKSWKKNQNIELIKPNNYEPNMGTGFLPGENFPGII